MVNVLAIIPFFGGSSTATHSLEETRKDYLARTIASINDQLGVAPRVYQAKTDKVDVPGSTRLDVDPIWLPWAACVNAQQASDEFDVIYVTEADQVLHVHDEDVLEIPNDTRYLAPWRLDMVGPNGECELGGGARYEIGDPPVEYSIANGSHHLMQEAGWGVLPIHANQQAFSGAFFATRDYFRRIKFRKMRLLPVEHATGFDANAVGTCVKTEWLERCWVDHLSPRDRWQQPS